MGQRMSELNLKSKEKELGIGRIRRVRLREMWSHEALEKKLGVAADPVSSCTPCLDGVVTAESWRRLPMRSYS